MTEGALAGEKLSALEPLFPAATTVVTPKETRLAAASLMAAETGPVKLMEATEGRPLCLAAPAIQSIAEMLRGRRYGFKYNPVSWERNAHITRATTPLK